MGRSYWIIWAATLLFFAAFYTLLIPFPLYLSTVGLPDWQIAVVMGALGIASLIVRPLAGVFSDTLGRRNVMLIGTGALVAGSVAVGERRGLREPSATRNYKPRILVSLCPTVKVGGALRAPCAAGRKAALGT